MEGLLLRGTLVELFRPGGLVVDGGDQREDRRRVQFEVRGLVLQKVVGVLVDPGLQRLVHFGGAGLTGEGRRVVLLCQRVQRLLVVSEALVQPQGVGKEARADAVVLVVRGEEFLHPFPQGRQILLPEQVEELLPAVPVRGLRQHGEGQVDVDGGVQRVLARVLSGRLAGAEDLREGLLVEGFHRLLVAFAGLDPFLVPVLVCLELLVRRVLAGGLDGLRVDGLREGQVAGGVGGSAGRHDRAEHREGHEGGEHRRQPFHDSGSHNTFSLIQKLRLAGPKPRNSLRLLKQ